MSSQPIGLITDGGELRARGELIPRVREILEAAAGRVCFLQIRERNVADAELVDLLGELRPICESHNTKLVINSRPELVSESLAHRFHSGSEAKEISDFPFSASAHSTKEARRAAELGAKVILAAPVFNPLSKKSSRPALGIDGLSELVEAVSIPVFALGGVTPQNCQTCLIAGASGVAMITSLLFADAPARATKELLTNWDSAS